MTEYMSGYGTAVHDAVRVMPDGRKVTAIPARMQRCATGHMLQTNRPRVAAYARVSTDQEEQETSFEAQCDYYSKLLRGNPAWEYAGLYTDDGVSATSTARREGFNRLIADALDGKIDRIITKSVSRFARNTVDSLTTIRRLKEKGVGVTFEKENIDTLDSKGELMITIMSSLAQEESRSISENVTWGWRKRIADGKVSMTYGNFLGYERGADGTPVIDEAQARIVRQIYGMFLDGQTPSSIAATLTRLGVPTPTGRTNWQNSTVKSILTNEKYKGDALLQKTITVDFLSKAHKINEGEAPQFFVENSHPAIISREIYDLVQLELQRRGKRGRHTSAKSIFSDRLICGECGATFGSKVWHSTDPYRKVIWRCNQKYTRKDEKCPNRHLNEEKIKEAFVIAVNQLVIQRTEILDTVLQRITDLIHENATTKMDQGEYNCRYDGLETQHDAISDKQKRIKEKLSDKLFRKRKLEAFVSELKSAEQLIYFDEQLFIRTVEQITVFPDKLVFVFKDGTEIPVEE